MDRDHFWLTDAQFARMAPHLPTDTRGKPRVDDRRVISGIVQVLKSGGRWIDAPDVYGPRWRTTSAPSDRQFGGEGPPLGLRRQRGEHVQAIGRSRRAHDQDPRADRLLL